MRLEESTEFDRLRKSGRDEPAKEGEVERCEYDDEVESLENLFNQLDNKQNLNKDELRKLWNKLQKFEAKSSERVELTRSRGTGNVVNKNRHQRPTVKWQNQSYDVYDRRRNEKCNICQEGKNISQTHRDNFWEEEGGKLHGDYQKIIGQLLEEMGNCDSDRQRESRRLREKFEREKREISRHYEKLMDRLVATSRAEVEKYKQLVVNKEKEIEDLTEKNQNCQYGRAKFKFIDKMLKRGSRKAARLEGEEKGRVEEASVEDKSKGRTENVSREDKLSEDNARKRWLRRRIRVAESTIERYRVEIKEKRELNQKLRRLRAGLGEVQWEKELLSRSCRNYKEPTTTGDKWQKSDRPHSHREKEQIAFRDARSFQRNRTNRDKNAATQSYPRRQTWKTFLSQDWSNNFLRLPERSEEGSSNQEGIGSVWRNRPGFSSRNVIAARQWLKVNKQHDFLLLDGKVVDAERQQERGKDAKFCLPD
ncbi:golgin IMH1-like isoform X2 [Centruroides sculpturatus]|uniref:golgin IMH1-like isoform X2 n=1 Tax=Centruroides sculpturatus TaxID=218467 RepID=UPI000C6D2BBD|nr:golgin IMH1-like isoform X2 [Centruroides sculpturatus]